MLGEWSEQEITRQLNDVEADFELIRRNKWRVIGRQVAIAIVSAYGNSFRELRLIAPVDTTDKPAGSLEV